MNTPSFVAAPICLECAASAATCCSLSGGGESSCFPLSEPEMERIVLATGREDFWALEPNGETFIALMSRLFVSGRAAVLEKWPLDGSHCRLRTTPEGKCVFLGPSGCTLPLEVRPHHCRIFPFWVYANQVTYFEDEQCLAARNCRSLAWLLQALKMKKKQILGIYDRLCRDWGVDLRAKSI